MASLTSTLLLVLHAAHASLVDIADVDRAVLFMELYNKASAPGWRRALAPRARISEHKARAYVGKAETFWTQGGTMQHTGMALQKALLRGSSKSPLQGRYIVKNKVLCIYNVCRMVSSIVCAKAAFAACGTAGSVGVFTGCMLCCCTIDGICYNCYYKGHRLRHLMVVHAPDVCAVCTRDPSPYRVSPT
ncbi:UNVERIFIED_CONTAM: hypothetical protein PYX00_011609 [Menopon gallinae]|uniref:Uncharacterized protein n=1 Tax=Menopon gallinae TaxID=328185 RepID=A0AAW2H7W5_9NEOP